MLALLCEEEGVAARVLTNFGLQLDKVREEILAILTRSSENEGSEDYSPQSRIRQIQRRGGRNQAQ